MAGPETKKPKLLSGGNPQIAKGYGDAPVQEYIAAMPSWKRDIGRRIDHIITRTTPDAQKAVKWNSPLYGIEGQGWFLSVEVDDADGPDAAFVDQRAVAPDRLRELRSLEGRQLRNRVGVFGGAH